MQEVKLPAAGAPTASAAWFPSLRTALLESMLADQLHEQKPTKLKPCNSCQCMLHLLIDVLLAAGCSDRIEADAFGSGRTKKKLKRLRIQEMIGKTVRVLVSGVITR